MSYPQLTKTITAQKKVSEEKTTKMNVKIVDVNDDAVAAPAAASAAAAPHPAVAAAPAAAASTAAVASAVAMAAAAGDGRGGEPSKNGNGKPLFYYFALLNTFLSFLLINNYLATHIIFRG